MKDIRRPQACWILAVSFDIIDAALSKHLYGRVTGSIEYVREQVVAGRVIYRLSNRHVGEFGEVEVRKRSADASEISFSIWWLPPLSENRDEVNRQRERMMRDVFDYIRWRLSEEEQDLQTLKNLNQSESTETEFGINVNSQDGVVIGGDVVGRDKVQVINFSPGSTLIIVKPDGIKERWTIDD